MANNPGKVGREGAASETLNEQADIWVDKPVDKDWLNAPTDPLDEDLYSPQLVELSKKLERFLLDDLVPFTPPRAPLSWRLILEHVIITKIYKIKIRKRKEKKIFEAMVRETLGLDKGDTSVDNTAYTNGVGKLVEMTIQFALDVKLEMQRLSQSLAAGSSLPADMVVVNSAANATDGAGATAGFGTRIDAAEQGDEDSQPRCGPGR
ncbi:hypothetical protein GE21DRAFT_2426 [Neurospora crassa]|uniref:Uncharacterized protein n=2 Tax=Neurospora crassa TaxID=5141 RepID=Q7SDC5_NEUCR|nr:hypothetical protein NCU02867 [Neurospora crassa OR74A]EAA34765.1 hypothetical protein NCU02867 [Neurospora crassa OR74A]KHE78692.1 hypothetical protein GE21DRAFT_2426 [Neurospora crassa]CAE76218.1 hypothetical protein [Neurospora crassa]|eukprot:XP_964001.1 hypothetical protein NCU02867 [Neurospora crassa OR74A]